MSEDTGGPFPDDVAPLAHRLLALDLSVIPVPRPRPGVPPGQPGDGKVPAIAWSAYQERRPTAREIDAWFGAAPMNLAVITGQVSGVVVVDADEPEALRWLVRRLPWTPWQTQTARGFHLWYRHPGVRVPNRARVDTGAGTLKIDVRGDGGYVIAPGSVHASGAAYLQAGDWSEPRARVPVFWPGWLARPPRPAAKPTPAPEGPRDALRAPVPIWRRCRSQKSGAAVTRTRCTPPVGSSAASRCHRWMRKRCCGNGPAVARAGRVSGWPRRSSMRSATARKRSGPCCECA